MALAIVSEIPACLLIDLLLSSQRCTGERFVLILDVAVDVLHEVDRHEGGIHTE